MPPIPKKADPVPPPAPAEPTPQKHRGEQVAVNLWDLDKVHPEIVRLVFAGKVTADKGSAFKVNDSHEDTAILFSCDPHTAAVACDVLRSECRRCEIPVVRVYVCPGPGRRWVRVPEKGVLTWVDDKGASHLSPEWFGSGDVPEPTPLRPKAVRLGKG